jgi:hypothetical protein
MKAKVYGRTRRNPAMNSVPNVNDDRRLAQARPASVQACARIGPESVFLLSIVAGGFGEAYVPYKLIVSADATATARNINAFDSLFRLGFAIYLIEAVCDIALREARSRRTTTHPSRPTPTDG